MYVAAAPLVLVFPETIAESVTWISSGDIIASKKEAKFYLTAPLVVVFPETVAEFSVTSGKAGTLLLNWRVTEKIGNSLLIYIFDTANSWYTCFIYIFNLHIQCTCLI